MLSRYNFILFSYSTNPIWTYHSTIYSIGSWCSLFPLAKEKNQLDKFLFRDTNKFQFMGAQSEKILLFSSVDIPLHM